MKWLARLATTRSWFVVIFFILITVFMMNGLRSVVMDDSTDAMQPDESDVVALNEEIDATFGERPDLAIVLLEGDIYTPAALEQVRDLTKAVNKIEHVAAVTSVSNGAKFEDDDGFLLIEDMLPKRGDISEEDIASMREFMDSSYLYKDGLLISENGKFTPMLIELDSDVDGDVFTSELNAAIDEHWQGKSYVSGEIAIESVMLSTMQRDLPRLTGLAALLILIFLFLNFRTIQGAVLPIITVFMGLLWSLGALGYLGIDMTTMSIIAPIAIMAVGSSFSLHLLGRYYYELARDTEKKQAIHTMMGETGLGVVISGIAIAAAMSTFLLSEISGVRGLGIQTAIGVLAALLASVTFLPAMLNILPIPKNVADPEKAGFIGGFLNALANWVIKSRRLILGITAVILAISIFGAMRIQVNTNILSFFPQGSAIRQSTDVVEENFGGAGQMQIRIKGDLNDPKLLEELLTFQEDVKEIEGMGPSQSVATIIRELHQVLTTEEGMPASREAVAQELLMWQMSADNPSDITEVITLDSSQGLLTVTAALVSSQQTRRVVEEVKALAGKTFTTDVELDYTGTLIENTFMEDALLKDFITSLTLAIILVIIIDSFVRSVRAAVVTILALLITIAMQYGFLGYLGVSLDIATMLLGALAIGVGDYAIHLTVRYMEERRNGLEPEAAMHDSILSSGRAIFFTALTLGAGFFPLVFGSIVPISRLGSFMVFTVVAVGVASLTLLPAACLTFLRNPGGKVTGATGD